METTWELNAMPALEELQSGLFLLLSTIFTLVLLLDLNYFREDMRKLEVGLHIVVGTPGRVFDMISRKVLRPNISSSLSSTRLTRCCLAVSRTRSMMSSVISTKRFR